MYIKIMGIMGTGLMATAGSPCSARLGFVCDERERKIVGGGFVWMPPHNRAGC